jgi:hypothetical protein
MAGILLTGALESAKHINGQDDDTFEAADREDIWIYFVNNAFAAGFLQTLNRETLPQLITSSNLCHRCATTVSKADVLSPELELHFSRPSDIIGSQATTYNLYDILDRAQPTSNPTKVIRHGSMLKVGTRSTHSQSMRQARSVPIHSFADLDIVIFSVYERISGRWHQFSGWISSVTRPWVAGSFATASRVASRSQRNAHVPTRARRFTTNKSS